MIGFVIWGIITAMILTAGAYAIDSANTAHQPPLARHRKGL